MAAVGLMECVDNFLAMKPSELQCFFLFVNGGVDGFRCQ